MCLHVNVIALNIKDKFNTTDVTVSSKFWSLIESNINMPDTNDFNGDHTAKVDVSVSHGG